MHAVDSGRPPMPAGASLSAGGSHDRHPNSSTPVAHAYARTEPARPAALRGSAWKIWLVCGDCFLIGLAPVLVHMAKTKEGVFAFNPVAVNFLVELAKTAFALGSLIAYGAGRPGPPPHRSLRAFLSDAEHNKALAVPAALYAVNGYLKFAMQLFFKPTTAKMLGNLKILVIALLMRSVLRRSFTVFQWEALFLLVAGISVNQLSGCGTGGEVVTFAAAAYTVGSITVPSLASVYNEAALKKHMETSVLLQNFFLYLFGAGFNLLGLVALMVTGRLAPLEAFGGFSAVTVLLVVNNALQGILSSFFFKYADTILKKYSSTIATIFTAVMSAALFGHALSPNFCIGVSIVFISMHIFFSLGGTKGGKAPPGQKVAKLTVSPSMDHLALRLPDAVSVGSELAARGQEGFAVFQGGEGSVPPPRDKVLPR